MAPSPHLRGWAIGILLETEAVWEWKGFLSLSLVTCPVALFPATSESEKVSFNQINKNTGYRIKYLKVDADTGEKVSNDDIIKGYRVDTDTYVTVDIFVPKSEIDELYWCGPTTSRRRARSAKCIGWKLGGGRNEGTRRRRSTGVR